MSGRRRGTSGRAGRRPGTAAIVGGGIAGLATAALLARDGWSVTLFEARDELGGRAGSWESGGFRFDTGPSWYLMPEVFEHFFRLLGTTADAELDLVTLDPAYRVYPQPDAEGTDSGSTPVDVRSGRALARALFEEREPGAGVRLDEYLDSARSAYDLAVDRFLYDTYASYGGLADPAVTTSCPGWCRCSRAPSRTTWRARSPTPSCARSWDTPRSSSAPPPTPLPRSTTS